jgi:choline kinase
MSTISEAVVLMAGTGSRLSSPSTGALKPLTPILDRPLISYLFDQLSSAGIRRVHAVVGYQAESLVTGMKTFIPASLDVQFVHNLDWQKQNGISVLAASGRVKAPFVLTMSDHLFDQDLLEFFLSQVTQPALNLAIDRKIEAIVDIDDAMKVVTRRDRVVTLGKELTRYDAIDTGLFVANEELFDYLEATKRNDDCSLADGVRLMAADDKVRAIDIGDAWWQDVDTPKTFLAAENHLRRKLEPLSPTNV